MSTWNLFAVPDFQVPQNAPIAAQPALIAVCVQCTSIYALIDTYIVPEVPDFLNDRELARESSKIKGVIFVFLRLRKFLSIAEKVRNFRDRAGFLVFLATRTASMASKQSFYEWLIKQVDRDDPVGDLARDAKGDHNFPVSATHFGRVLGHLAAMGAGQPAQQALQEAWREYRTA